MRNRITINGKINYRFEVLEGESHIVLPVVMLVPGVHHGSGGRALYIPEEYGKHPMSWNGEPVPIYHPKKEGMPISCNEPEVLEKQNVGRLFNVHMDGEKLKGETWINVAKLNNIYPDLIDLIRNGEDIEVSTSFFSDDELISGEWRGETYDCIVRNIRPDHLAILPGSTGACSYNKGCGIRENSGKGGINLKVRTEEEAERAIKDLAENSSEIGKKKGWIMNKLSDLISYFSFSTNEPSHEDVRRKIQSKVDSFDSVAPQPPPVVHYVVDVFDNYFIYEQRQFVEGGGEPIRRLFKQGYTVDENDDVKLQGKAENVKQETNYVNVNENKESKQEVDKKMERKEEVDLLINSDESTFCESDRAFLMNLDCASFQSVKDIGKRFSEKYKSSVEALRQNTDGESSDTGTSSGDSDNGGGSVSVKDDTTQGKLTVNDYIDGAPEEIKEVLIVSLTQMENTKKNLIGKITQNTDLYKSEELGKMTINDLERIAALACQRIDYSGQTPALQSNIQTENTEQQDGSGVPKAPGLKQLCKKE